LKGGRESGRETGGYVPDGTVQPGERKPPSPTKASRAKWVLFISAIFYLLLASYYGSILAFMGRYLIVSHPLRKADLVVCLSGRNIERGLASADVYKAGYAAKVFMAREMPPDGYSILRERGITYPETVDLLKRMLVALGIPDSALIVSENPVKGTFEEAMVVRRYVRRHGLHSLILVTSPTHARRAWLTFRRVFKEDSVWIGVHPTPYSRFNPQDWWTQRRYLKEVTLEYQKLLYYLLMNRL